MTGVLIRRDMDADTDRGQPSRTEPFPHDPEKKAILPAPRFSISSLQNWDK